MQSTGKIHELFYDDTPYFIIPRMLLQELPEELQEEFVEIVRRAEALGYQAPSDYQVFRRDRKGQLRSDDPYSKWKTSSLREAQLLDRIEKLGR